MSEAFLLYKPCPHYVYKIIDGVKQDNADAYILSNL